MLTKVATKPQARARVIQQGATSPWSNNMILDRASNVMSKGYTAAPNPEIGQSSAAVDRTQSGVIAPLRKMVIQKTDDSALPRYTMNGLYATTITWSTQYSYINDDTGVATIAEFGYPGLNRLLFRDEKGVPKIFTISPKEEIIVEVEFTITLAGLSTPTKITILDQNKQTIDQLGVTVQTAKPARASKWWELLALAPTGGVVLVTDIKWNGGGTPASINPSEVTAVVSKGTKIGLTVSHIGATGGTVIKGYIVNFKSGAPAFHVVFDHPVTIGGGYRFDAGFEYSWG